ncbi:hypothetical protein CK203_095045 [Vitis vinifera]|uniref:Uncharacterized protein n=1 Tax=Vitis vinifera TaxID=29760 RepID=A0A438C7Z7_VITVI|nr:hypothetical protein CK203_095045 [Vitis vinifera]
MDLVEPIISTVRDVEIRLSPESICCIFDIPSVGLKVRLGDGKPSAHSLTVISRVLHHMICSILLTRGGHRDDVSYLEAFLIDSILTGRRISCGVSDDDAHDIMLQEHNPTILGRMKFEKALDDSWIRRAERPPAQARGQGQMHPRIKEAQIREMEDKLTWHSYGGARSSQ